MTSQTDANGSTNQYVYDARRTVNTQIDGRGTKTSLIHDFNNNRPTMTYQAGVVSTSYSYSCGNLVSLIRGGYVPGSSAKQNQTYNMEYDGFGNMTGISVGSRQLASYDYGPRNGKLRSMTYGNTDTVSYSYDILGRVTEERWKDKLKYQYVYSSDGYLAKKLDVTTGKAVNYEYDSLGRLIHSYQIDNGTIQQRTEHLYDSENRLTSQSWQLGDTRYKESYKYNANDGSLTSVNLDGMVGYAYLYDSLKRLNAQYNWLYGRFYTYRTNNGNQTTQIASINYTKRDGGTGFNEFGLGYEYDAGGNITKVTHSTNTAHNASYTYDSQNQLTKEVNTNGTYNYTYDTYGNIRSVSGAESHTYTYGDSEWLDLLTAYDGKSITYDAIGNPAVWHNSSGDWELSWSNGRQLTEANKGSHFISYTYDLAGIRDSKTVDGVTYNYITQNRQVVRQTWGDHVMDFIYDNTGKPYALKYDGTTYYYVLNLQGDVMSIITHWGESYGSYTYDAWGNVLSVSGDIAYLNPIRYRGYYYDSETRLYYLGSRYYDPQVKRFINADIFASTGQGFIGCNMFAYCNNSPVSSADKTATSASDVAQAWSEGMWWITFLDGPAPVMDSIYVAGVIILFAISLSQSEDDTNDPDVTYPGDDPTQAPDGYEWTGPDEQGGRRGGYKNKDPNKKDSWHPDLNNEKEGPHWDYNDGKGHKWRVYPNGKITPAKSAGVSTIYRLSARTYPKKRSTRIVRVRSVRSMRV